jgi:hypothetical protein
MIIANYAPGDLAQHASAVVAANRNLPNPLTGVQSHETQE